MSDSFYDHAPSSDDTTRAAHVAHCGQGFPPVSQNVVFNNVACPDDNLRSELTAAEAPTRHLNNKTWIKTN